jgi:23S rRNA-/tRNA-specific pseudouridylate synthase
LPTAQAWDLGCWEPRYCIAKNKTRRIKIQKFSFRSTGLYFAMCDSSCVIPTCDVVGILQKFLHPDAVVVNFDSNGLIAVEKPANVLSHPNGKMPDRRALICALYDAKSRCYTMTDRAVAARCYVLNRLDSITSGLLLLSLHKSVATSVRSAFLAGKVKKTYHAFVRHNHDFTHERWTDMLQQTHRKNLLRTYVGGTDAAITDAFLLEKRSLKNLHIAIVELHPITGRTHQLRVQCANHGMPIVGDKTYGDFQWNRAIASTLGCKAFQLQSSSVQLTYDIAGKSFHFSATSPNLSKFKEWIKFDK